MTIHHKPSERGSALVYILIAIALLAALTVTFMEPSSQQTSSQGSLRSATQIQSQIDSIRSAVQECVLRYGNGDQAATDAGANKTYPLKPNSTYLTSPTAGRLVRDIKCPGNNGGGAANDHQPVFAGGSGKFLPAPPDLFEEWEWYNGADGVFFWTRTTKTDDYLVTALEKLDEKFSECEADIVTAGGSAVDMDSDATAQASCPANNVCFRVWFTNNATAPHGDWSVDNTCGASDI